MATQTVGQTAATKKRCSVMVPIAGYAYVDVIVPADATEEDIIGKALNVVTFDHVEEWEPHERIVEGNVFYGNCNEASIESEEDAGEDEPLTE